MFNSQLTGVRNLLLDGVRRWHRDLHFDLVRAGHFHVVRLVDRDLHLVRHLLLDDDWVRFLDLHGVGLGDLDLVGLVDGDLYLTISAFSFSTLNDQ